MCSRLYAVALRDATLAVPAVLLRPCAVVVRLRRRAVGSCEGVKLLVPGGGERLSGAIGGPPCEEGGEAFAFGLWGHGVLREPVSRGRPSLPVRGFPPLPGGGTAGRAAIARRDAID